MSAQRIVVVGGGSQFSIALCDSFVDYARDRLAGSTVVLLDTNPDDVAIVHGYGQQLAAAVGADVRFEATGDRRAAFDGADQILTTFRPGTHAELEQDETIPVRHGLQGNETVGIGGMFMAARVAPVLREICADAEELCPDATLVNYTNPTQYVADMVGRISDLRVISLCDGYIDLENELGWLLGVDPSLIELQVAGTNHAMWVLDFTVGGEPGYPLLRERLDHLDAERAAELREPPSHVEMLGIDFPYADIYKQFAGHYSLAFNVELYELYGLIPGPTYYWRYLLDQDAVLAAQRRSGYVTMAGFYTRHLHPRMFAGLDERRERVAAELAVPREPGASGHGDLAVRVHAAIATDADERFVVNVRNGGAVTNLPDDAVLELSATVGADGARPLPVGDLPEELVGFQADLVRSQRMAVAAALDGDREQLLKAIVAHPLVSSLHAARAAMDELLDRQAAWLPQFEVAVA